MRKPPQKLSTPKKPPRKKRRRSFIGFFLKGFLLLLVWGSIFVAFALVWFTYDLPDINKLQMPVRKPSVTVLSQDGQVIATYGDLYEEMVRVEELPLYVSQAFLAIEDCRFYSHFGLDVIGLSRAAYKNYMAGRVVQGGSSITQQLAKNFLVSYGLYSVHDRTLRRKVQEALMALWLEWHFSKNQILTIYLNRVYFGSGTYGIDAASRKYFEKPAKQLSVLEAAILAGLLKAPSKYSPAHNLERALNRAKIVLQQMVEAGFLKEADPYLKQGELLKAEAKLDQPQSGRFFGDWIYETIPNYLSVDGQDLIVVTTLDLNLQILAENAVLEKFAEMAEKLKTTEIGAVIMTSEGAVKAMVGGKNYAGNQYNHVTQAQRQAGSTFKIFIYLAALEAGLSPETMIEDTPFSVGRWSPKNFRLYKPQGEISLEDAFAYSVNAPTIRLALHVGPPRIIALAHRLGITSKINPDLSISLGTCTVTLLELTSSFATFANRGMAVWPYGILEIRDKQGQILYRRQAPQEISLLAPLPLQQIQQLLKAAVTRGTGRGAQIGVPMYGKTGSNGDRDAWFVGSVEGGLVGGVWTGNDDNKDMHRDSMGGRLPARAWAAMMKEAIQLYPPQSVTTLDAIVAENLVERLDLSEDKLQELSRDGFDVKDPDFEAMINEVSGQD